MRNPDELRERRLRGELQPDLHGRDEGVEIGLGGEHEAAVPVAEDPRHLLRELAAALVDRGR